MLFRSRVEPYGGIGAVIREARRFEPTPPGPVVVQVFEGSPAAGAGLRDGDAVIAVDDVAASAITGPLTERVRGAPGTIVHLRIDRPGVTAPFDLAIARGTVTVQGRPAAELGRAGASSRVGMLFQHGALFSAFTVLENIAFPLRERGTQIGRAHV